MTGNPCNPKLSIIIPTVGRESIRGTLASIYGQLQRGDEVIVVGDGPQPLSEKAANYLGLKYLETEPTREWGHAQRNFGMTAAKGDYLAFIDDDDYYLPHALEFMRTAILEDPGKVFLFKIEDGVRAIWEDERVRFSNVSTQMFVVPNNPNKLGKWQKNVYDQHGKGGDYRFICDTVVLYAPGDLIYRPEIIARVPFHSGGV
jgi:glycosyltransferase involved in cell wall biosynthesis